MHLARTHVHWVDRVNEIIYAQIKSTKFSNNPNLPCWFRITWNSLQSFPLKRQAILRATWATRLTTCSQVFVNNTSSTWGAAPLSFGHRSYLTRLPASREKQRPDLRLTGQGVQESYSQKLKNNKCRPWPCRYHSLHLQLPGFLWWSRLSEIAMRFHKPSQIRSSEERWDEDLSL